MASKATFPVALAASTTPVHLETAELAGGTGIVGTHKVWFAGAWRIVG